MQPVKSHPLIASALALTLAQALHAQTPSTPAATAASAPAAAASAPPTRARPPAAAATQRVEITGGRENDADQRRQSTAAKIVIGREEIERFGDSTVGEVLKRLPGVTTQGPPGRGGPPRMRGLGAGYTQILIDGQRAPQGFSVESLTPEQLERIEIFRAPTAETGARAIGGTINIVTREGFKVRLNDVRIGAGYENGKVSPGLSWTHNDSIDNFIYNLSASVFNGRRTSESTTTTTDEDIASGAITRQQVDHSTSADNRVGMNLTSRLQWRGEAGDMLMLMPVLFTTRAESKSRFDLTQSIGSTPPLYDLGESENDSRFTSARLNGNWRTRLGGGFRLDMNGGLSDARGANHSIRQERSKAGNVLRTIDDEGSSRERSLTLNGKTSKLLEGDHSFVSGFEIERLQRTSTRRSLQNGVPLLTEFDETLEASSRRLALFAQDEWQLNANWSAHAGLRWEGITTQGDAGDGPSPTNHSKVLTPLLHAVWKPDPKTRDQVRFSLTRSYKSPTLQNLIARPNISSRYPASGANIPTSPDRAGNPLLQPELARGIDVAFERYLSEGGVLSANIFVRRLNDYIRNVTALETVSWSAQQRYVSRPQNIGDATTKGIELEAKFRLDQVFGDGPRTEVRSNLSLYRSRVDTVPGPDNRLDQQPHATANLGFDHRFRGTPLTLGASVNWTPGYRTQVSELQAVTAGTKRQFDAYGLWVVNPAMQLRLNVSNIAPQDYLSSNTLEVGNLRERSSTLATTNVNWRMALELKL